MEIDKLNCAGKEVTCEPILKTKSSRCSSKRPKMKKNPINSYNKMQIIKRLKDQRFSLENFMLVLDMSRVPKDAGIKHYKERAEYSQNIVGNEVGCNAAALRSVHELLETFKIAKVPEKCYEASVVVAAIANNETHPNSKNLFKVNLRSIYKFLADTLMGLPAKPLKKMSAQFLSKAFKSFHSDVTKHAENHLKIAEMHSVTREKFSVNPLGLSLPTRNEYE